MIIEFFMGQYILVGIFLILLFLLLKHENRKAGHPVTTQELSNLINKEDGVILDVREPSDFRTGHIVDAKNIPFRELTSKIAELNDYKDQPVIVVCKIGQTASSASKQLKAAGFSKVYKLTGGLSEWQSSNLPLVQKG